MRITKLVFKHYGPFSSETTLHLEADVTVLTGANDTGKSSILNIIDRICTQTAIGENEVNNERLGETTNPWQNDTEITCLTFFEGTKWSSSHSNGKWGEGDSLEVFFRLAPHVKTTELSRLKRASDKDWGGGQGAAISKYPTIIRLPNADSIRSIIDLTNPNNAERLFLQSAFGEKFSYEKIKNLSDSQYYAYVSKGKNEINAKVREFMCNDLRYEFDFQTASTKNQLSLQLRDLHQGHTSLALRGAGVQKLISTLATLFSRDLTAGHFVLLIDEPETSLHADAQHQLRTFLENIASRGNVQAVYATHSPSMINTTRPHAIRLFQRTTSNDGKATSTIIHRPIDKNFLLIRGCLGISPSDSLLFSPVVVIVEGVTDMLGIPLALAKLAEDPTLNFADDSKLLQHCHFLDGEGDSFEYYCRIVKSYGSKPIVFLDSDKENRINKLRKEHPDVPVILMAPGQEFENIVSTEAYFEAIYEEYHELAIPNLDSITVDRYRDWEKTSRLPAQMMFTKRIDRWLTDDLSLQLTNKPGIMKRALQRVKPNQINSESLSRLMTEIKKLI